MACHLRITVILALLFGLGTAELQAQQEHDRHLRRLSREMQKDRVRTPEGWYHDPKPHGRFRGFLSRINLEIGSGYGITHYSHFADGLAVYSGTQGVRLFSPANYTGGSISSSLDQWFNTSSTTGSFAVGANDFVVNTDTARVKFRSNSKNIPLSAALFFYIDRFKIGGGFNFEPQYIAPFESRKDFSGDIASWRAEPRLAFVKKYYGIFGADIYRVQDFIFSADLRVGVWNPGNRFALGQMDRSVFFNFGGQVEWELSRYFRPYIRPNYEFKNFVLSIPESPNTIRHRANQVTVQVGVILRLPELPRCFLKKCHIQMNHQHGDREYRSRVHPIWKKQNPNYGENYPRLFKYRWKNKGKLHPY